MTPYNESGIEFDFTAAVRHSKHDAINRYWPGVDFILEEVHRSIWLEVKNWEPASLPPRRRGGQRKSFLSKMRSSRFFTETLRAKFLGTTAFLTLSGVHPPSEILYVILLESPRLDSALMLHATTRMRGLLPARGPWSVAIGVVVVNLAHWNVNFAIYPARLIS